MSREDQAGSPAACGKGTGNGNFAARGLWTLIHGMGFGALYLLACSGALVEL